MYKSIPNDKILINHIHWVSSQLIVSWESKGQEGFVRRMKATRIYRAGGWLIEPETGQCRDSRKKAELTEKGPMSSRAERSGHKWQNPLENRMIEHIISPGPLQSIWNFIWNSIILFQVPTLSSNSYKQMGSFLLKHHNVLLVLFFWHFIHLNKYWGPTICSQL